MRSKGQTSQHSRANYDAGQNFTDDFRLPEFDKEVSKQLRETKQKKNDKED